jgi:hypothetical protein
VRKRGPRFHDDGHLLLVTHEAFHTRRYLISALLKVLGKMFPHFIHHRKLTTDPTLNEPVTTHVIHMMGEFVFFQHLCTSRVGTRHQTVFHAEVGRVPIEGKIFVALGTPFKMPTGLSMVFFVHGANGFSTRTRKAAIHACFGKVSFQLDLTPKKRTAQVLIGARMLLGIEAHVQTILSVAIRFLQRVPRHNRGAQQTFPLYTSLTPGKMEFQIFQRARATHTVFVTA